MPELPEVETSRRGIEPHIVGIEITGVTVRHHQLRWPIPSNLRRKLIGSRFLSAERRAKYLLLCTDHGTLILHLGMSGSLRIVPAGSRAEKHDHLDIAFANGVILRLTDPRRFGAALWHEGDPLDHPLLRELGPEPLGRGFNSRYLHRVASRSSTAIKPFLMNNRVVVGVGNIYANESLFLSGISPLRPANTLESEEIGRLVKAIKEVLRRAIRQGGTTLKDFVGSDGRPGYFAQQLNVYGREGLSCPRCGGTILACQQGQRKTFYCPHCQN